MEGGFNGSGSRDLYKRGISGGSKNFEGGKAIYQPVLIYRKCTQRSIGLLHGKSAFLENKLSQWGAAAPTPPFESATEGKRQRVWVRNLKQGVQFLTFSCTKFRM